nr:hypothetical protein [Tanacetum cinerariifolium]
GPHETFQFQPTNKDYYHEQNSCYNSNTFGSDHCQPPKYTVNHPIFNAHNDFLNSQNELSITQNTIMEQMTQLTSMYEMVCQIVQKKQEEKRIEEEQAANARYWKIPACCDDDDDYDFAITPILSTEETENSLTKDHVEIVVNSKDGISSSDDDSLYNENIEYVEAEGDILFLERLLHDDHIPLPDTLDFSYEVRIFLPFFTYPVTSPVLLSFRNEYTIFDPGITINHFIHLSLVHLIGMELSRISILTAVT